MRKSWSRFNTRRQPDETSGCVKKLLPAIGAEADSKQCQRFQGYVHDELDRLKRFPDSHSIKNTQQLLDVVTEFRKTHSLSRDQAIDIVSSFGQTACASSADTSQQSYYSSVEVIVRIWTNLRVQIPRQPPAPSAEHGTIHWPGSGDTLQSLVSNHFEEKKGRPTTDLDTIDPKLSMDFLVRMYGYRVRWTSNLAEHLRINPKFPRQIAVYEHKIFLWNHLNMARDAENNLVLPLSVAEEAIDTLNLLFPFGEPSTESFLQREGKSFYGLGNCSRNIQWDIQRYQYWRKEIGDLAQVLTQPPRGIAQIMLDKDGTNTKEFLAFWTAIAFGVLAIIGVITGVYSAVYAKKAYDVGILQYQLALAQACSALNATDLLPGFCH